ncbi:MAG TPA: ribosome maturation factor RimP [Acidimicrobiia bacterium]|nr:ribosome maturation factor RimP [Acidimicrobiia bacterium]
MTTTAEIWELIEPYLAAEHLVLDDIELTGLGGGRVLRVAVDGEGVDVDRLAELSRGISRLLDNEASLEGSYQLEVTTPGLERKLRRPEHFQKSVGREVVAKVAAGDANRTIRGVIADAGASSFTVDGDNGPEVVSYESVLKAKTVFRWEKSPKPGH